MHKLQSRLNNSAAFKGRRQPPCIPKGTPKCLANLLQSVLRYSSWCRISSGFQFIFLLIKSSSDSSQFLTSAKSVPNRHRTDARLTPCLPPAQPCPQMVNPWEPRAREAALVDPPACRWVLSSPMANAMSRFGWLGCLLAVQTVQTGISTALLFWSRTHPECGNGFQWNTRNLWCRKDSHCKLFALGSRKGYDCNVLIPERTGKQWNSKGVVV